MRDDSSTVDSDDESTGTDSMDGLRANLSESGRRALAFLEGGLTEWKRLDTDDGTVFLATKRSDIESARQGLQKAEALGSEDALVLGELRIYRDRIENQEERVFHGSVLAGVLAIALGVLFIASGAGGRLAGVVYMAFAVLYFLAVQPRRFALNHRRMSDTTFTSSELAAEEGGSFGSRLMIAFFTAMFIHLITVWAFLRNYVFSR